MISLGGNKLKKIKFVSKDIILHSKYFNYKILFLKKNIIKKINNCSGLIILPNKYNNIKINNIQISSYENFFFQNQSLSIISDKDDYILFAFDKKERKGKKFYKKKIAHYKKVIKPWGYEIWFKNNLNFILKKISIKKGYKTSLQYHRFKKEVNLLYSGKIKLHYLQNTKIKKTKITKNEILSKTIKSPCSIMVVPPVVHRIEALTNIILYEVSTLQVNDVIRISDDTKRANGLIKSEHK